MAIINAALCVKTRCLTQAVRSRVIIPAPAGRRREALPDAVPLLCLPRRQAAIVRLGKARGAAADAIAVRRLAGVLLVSVAIASVSSVVDVASRRSVLAPIHCPLPGTGGLIVAGTSAAASWPTVVIGAIAWSNVMVMNGAIETGPSG